jgi:hypothetical protein
MSSVRAFAGSVAGYKKIPPGGGISTGKSCQMQTGIFELFNYNNCLFHQSCSAQFDSCKPAIGTIMVQNFRLNIFCKNRKSALTIFQSYQPKQICGFASTYPVTKPSTYRMSLFILNLIPCKK